MQALGTSQGPECSRRPVRTRKTFEEGIPPHVFRVLHMVFSSCGLCFVPKPCQAAYPDVSSLSSRFGVTWRRQRAQVQSGGRVSAFGLGISVRACLCLVTLVLAYARLADMQALLLVRVSAARRNGSASDSACLRRIWMCAQVTE